MNRLITAEINKIRKENSESVRDQTLRQPLLPADIELALLEPRRPVPLQVPPSRQTDQHAKPSNRGIP